MFAGLRLRFQRAALACRPGVPPSDSVRSILIWLVLACLLPGVVGSSAILYLSYQRERAQLEDDTIQTARALTQAVDAELVKAQAAAQALATSGHLASKDFAAFYAQATDLLQQTEIGNNVVLCDASGRQLVNTTFPFPGPLLRHGNPVQLRRVFELGKPVVSDVYLGGASGRPIMSIDVPVLRDGRVVYDLGIAFFPERLGRIPLAQRLSRDWVVSIFDTRGVIAARTRAARSLVGKKGPPALLRRMAESAEGMVEAHTLDGISISAIFNHSPSTNWAVVIGIPTQQFTAELRQRFLLLLAVVIILLAVGVGLASILGGRVARSIRALIAPAVALGSGAPVTVPYIRLREAAEVGAAMKTASTLLGLRSLAANVCHNSSDGIVTTGPDGIIVSVNPAYCAMTGYAAEELVGANPRIIKSHRHDADFYRGIWDAIRSDSRWQGEIWNRRKDGSLFLASESITTIRDGNGRIEHYVGVLGDITVARRAAEAMRRQAHYDPLTNLPNRLLFMDRLQHEMVRAHRNSLVLALLFIDLDRFKEVNDEFGHDVGDEMLKVAAARLAGCNRESDTVGRLGGDEFTAILSDLNGREGAALAARKMLAEMCRPFCIGHHEFSISASIGVALYPADGDDAADLLKAADAAMYQAKRGGRSAFAFASLEIARHFPATPATNVIAFGQ